MSATLAAPADAATLAGPGRASTWYDTTRPTAPPLPRFSGDEHVDVAIVGGGHTGVATALELAERGVRVALLEATRLGDGATGRNGGQVTGSLPGLSALRRQLTRHIGGEACTGVIHQLRWGAQTLIRERVARHGIDCALVDGHLHTAWRPGDIAELQDDLADAQAAGLGDRIEWLDRHGVHARLATPLYHGGALNRHNLHLNSLALCLGSAAAAQRLGAELHEHSPVLELRSATRDRPASLRTAQGVLSADTIVLAGNAYHRLYAHHLAGQMFPAILGNLATEPLDETTRRALNPDNLAVYDSRLVLDYYRFTEDGRLLFGGGTNYSGRELDNVADALRPRLERTFPQLEGVRIDHAWTGLAGIVPNRIPLLGRPDRGIVYAQGYSGHGIASSHLIARALADALHGDDPALFDTLAALHHPRLPGGQATLAAGMLLALGSDHAKSLIERLKSLVSRD